MDNSIAHFHYTESEGEAMAGSGVYLEIDISDAQRKINALRKAHTEKEMKEILRKSLRSTGRAVKTFVKREVSKYYEVEKTYVGKTVKSPRMTTGGLGGIGCTIPIKDPRGHIGGRYSAVGGGYGWAAAMHGKYEITASIVKGKTSTLPMKMEHQGGNPPFRNIGAQKLNDVAFTRTGEKTKNGKDAIASVSGLSVAQMPMNLAREDVKKDIKERLMERLEAEHAKLIDRCR